MVIQYPHTITIKPEAAATQNQTGDWVNGAAETQFTSICRAEPNAGVNMVSGVDGIEIKYTYAVYLPKTDNWYASGTKAELAINGQVIYASIIRFENSQLNSRLWL